MGEVRETTSRGSADAGTVGVGVGLRVGAGVGTTVGAGLGVGVGTTVGAGLGVGVGTTVGAGLGVGVGTTVGAGLGVGVGTTVGAGLGVGVGTTVGAGLGVGVGTTVGAGLGVGVGTTVGAGLGVGVGTTVGAGLGVGVGTTVGVGLGVEIGTGVGGSVGAEEGRMVDTVDGPPADVEVGGASVPGFEVGEAKAGAVGAGSSVEGSAPRKDAVSDGGISPFNPRGGGGDRVGSSKADSVDSASRVARTLIATTVAATAASIVDRMSGVDAASRESGAVVCRGASSPVGVSAGPQARDRTARIKAARGRTAYLLPVQHRGLSR